MPYKNVSMSCWRRDEMAAPCARRIVTCINAPRAYMALCGVSNRMHAVRPSVALAASMRCSRHCRLLRITLVASALAGILAAAAVSRLQARADIEQEMAWQ